MATGTSTCGDDCVFCFVDQNPLGLRDTLYFRDGDFRMSFLYGNYITVTNLRERDLARIVEQRLSPLYISVHCTHTPPRRAMRHVPGPAQRDRLADQGAAFAVGRGKVARHHTGMQRRHEPRMEGEHGEDGAHGA